MLERGRHRRRRGGRPVAELARAAHEAAAARTADVPDEGPFDESEVPYDGGTRLDLGSVRLPVPDGAQLQVEVDPSGPVRAVHVLTELGRLTVSAFAAPRSGGSWQEICDEIAAQLRGEGAQVREVPGDWGPEVHAVTGGQVTLRLVGVDGPRWLLRGVAAGPPASHEALVELLYGVLRDTVVVRGPEPLPVRTPLPITLPEPMAEQLRQVAEAREEEQARGEQP